MFCFLLLEQVQNTEAITKPEEKDSVVPFAQLTSVEHLCNYSIVVGVWDVVMLCLKSGAVEQTAGEAKA